MKPIQGTQITENFLTLIATSTSEISSRLNEINDTLAMITLQKPWYQEYQELIGTFFAAIIPVGISIYLTKRSEFNKKVNDYIEMTYLINKEINTIENYKKNIEKQVTILESLKYNETGDNQTLTFKVGPVIISNYKSFNVNNLYSTESNFINSQLTFCKNDSENFEFNSKLLASQIKDLFDRTNNLITLSFGNTEGHIISPDHIKEQFNDGIDKLTEILNNQIIVKLESHSVDFIVLLSAFNEYISLYRKSSNLFPWNLKYNKKYKLIWFNIFYRLETDDGFSVMYNYFKDKGQKEMEMVERH